MTAGPTDRGRVAVVGGSLAGLSAAVVLGHLGYAVDVFEQSARPLSSRGAGIVQQPELDSLLEHFDVVDPADIATSCSKRQYLARDGSAETSLTMPQRFTAWNAVYRSLRLAVADERHHQGRQVVAVEDGGDVARVHVADGTAHEVELVVAADGWSSSVRASLVPGVHTRYAGYVAWRGVADERDLSPAVLDALNDRFTFFHLADGGHFLCYLVPGADGELAVGSRRLNWVWYVHAKPGEELDTHMTDVGGRRRELSVPPGQASDALLSRIRRRARAHLPTVLGELVARTREPFVQAIIDLESPRMAWTRCCLIGDAAFVPRPHTAASTAKAAGDVLALAQALRRAGAGRVPEALRRWEPQRLAVGRALAEHGRRLGLRSPTAGAPIVGT